MDCIFTRSDGLNLNALMMDLFLKGTQRFTLYNVNRWTGVVWIIVLFGLSFWRHPFTAEDHCWASDVMLNFSKSFELSEFCFVSKFLFLGELFL